MISFLLKLSCWVEKIVKMKQFCFSWQLQFDEKNCEDSLVEKIVKMKRFCFSWQLQFDEKKMWKFLGWKIVKMKQFCFSWQLTIPTSVTPGIFVWRKWHGNDGDMVFMTSWSWSRLGLLLVDAGVADRQAMPIFLKKLYASASSDEVLSQGEAGNATWSTWPHVPRPGGLSCSTWPCVPRPGYVLVKFDGKSLVLSGRFRHMEVQECDLSYKSKMSSNIYEK